MESLQSKLLKIILKATGLKRKWKRTGDDLRHYLEKKQRKASHKPMKELYATYSITESEYQGFPYYELKPRSDLKQKHIIFLHGGGYIEEITSLHWEFVGKLLQHTHYSVTVPIYPLAPKYTYKHSFDMLNAIYSEIRSKYKPKDIILIGDSAGGGMILAFAELLKEKNLPQPGKLILLSPGLDMSFSNPVIPKIEKIDPLLATPAIKEAARWYADGLDTKHYLISPLYGDFEGLGKISVFTGTHDICNPDARKFKKLADEKGIELGFYEYPGMPHVWTLFGLPESKKAMKQIIRAMDE
ncbi:alpha/beta hydrolase fold domain-containing protein [Paenibacillus sp. GCM10027628]|uniref:alpha/beta hydrolase fold domain-containing protein n=1 Tax=Paenibacillus sp. GCM10027628 TaxID=3273413 RepID=UPI003644914B